MKKSIRIDFTGNAPKLDFNRPVEGFENTIQRALVNIGTHRNDLNLFENKGTDLLRRGVEGSLISIQAAQHQSNFAAIETLLFMREEAANTLDAGEGLSKIGLEPASPLENGRLNINAIFTSDTGEVVGAAGNI